MQPVPGGQYTGNKNAAHCSVSFVSSCLFPFYSRLNHQTYYCALLVPQLILIFEARDMPMLVSHLIGPNRWVLTSHERQWQVPVKWSRCYERVFWNRERIKDESEKLERAMKMSYIKNNKKWVTCNFLCMPFSWIGSAFCKEKENKMKCICLWFGGIYIDITYLCYSDSLRVRATKRSPNLWAF